MNKIKKNRLSKSFSIWGTFEDYETNVISNIKKIVNSKLKGPDFQIHVTLVGPILKYDETTSLVLKNLCSRTKNFKINLKRYELTEEKYTALFIKINKSKELLNLRLNLLQKLKIDNSNYYPHISLYYGLVENTKKKKIIDLLPMFPKKITLKKLCLVDVDENNNKWKILDTFNLM